MFEVQSTAYLLNNQWSSERICKFNEILQLVVDETLIKRRNTSGFFDHDGLRRRRGCCRCGWRWRGRWCSGNCASEYLIGCYAICDVIVLGCQARVRYSNVFKSRCSGFEAEMCRGVRTTMELKKVSNVPLDDGR